MIWTADAAKRGVRRQLALVTPDELQLSLSRCNSQRFGESQRQTGVSSDVSSEFTLHEARLSAAHSYS